MGDTVNIKDTNMWVCLRMIYLKIARFVMGPEMEDTPNWQPQWGYSMNEHQQYDICGCVWKWLYSNTSHTIHMMTELSTILIRKYLFYWHGYIHIHRLERRFHTGSRYTLQLDWLMVYLLCLVSVFSSWPISIDDEKLEWCFSSTTRFRDPNWIPINYDVSSRADDHTTAYRWSFLERLCWSTPVAKLWSSLPVFGGSSPQAHTDQSG